jgi:hypothetical protein
MTKEKPAVVAKAKERSAEIIQDLAFDTWFCAKVHESMNDARPAVGHDQVEAMFAVKRAALTKSR